MKKWVSLWLFIALGVAVVLWAALSWISPSVTCRGVQMHPGDVCYYASPKEAHTSKVQTYEQRVRVARQYAPVGVVAGLGITAFGVVLLVREKGAREKGARKES